VWLGAAAGTMVLGVVCHGESAKALLNAHQRSPWSETITDSDQGMDARWRRCPGRMVVCL